MVEWLIFDKLIGAVHSERDKFVFTYLSSSQIGFKCIVKLQSRPRSSPGPFLVHCSSSLSHFILVQFKICDFSVSPSPNCTFRFGTSLGLGLVLGLGVLGLGLGLDNNHTNYYVIDVENYFWFSSF